MTDSKSIDPFPERPLYHYTSLAGLIGIVESRSIWATHVAYLNDAAEIRYAIELLRAEILKIAPLVSDQQRKCLVQLQDWLNHGFINNHLLFASSFTENGNLLSQWRAYCQPGKGVSLGFDPDELIHVADRQLFQLTRCIYKTDTQLSLLREFLNIILATFDDLPPDGSHHPTQSYFGVFERNQDRLLQIAARIKHPAFSEEQEWRLVSPIGQNLREPSIQFRDGPARLIPYTVFQLPRTSTDSLSLDHVFLGPAAEHNLSFAALDIFLTNRKASPKRGIVASGIPWRTW